MRVIAMAVCQAHGQAVARRSPGGRRHPRARPDQAPDVVGGSACRRGDLQDGVLDVLGDGELDRVGQPPSRPGQRGEEFLGSAAGIGADVHLEAQVPWQLCQCEPGRLAVVRGCVRSGVARPQHDGRRLPGPAALWSANTVSAWNPKVFFQVGPPLLLERAITTMRSTSTWD